MVNGSVPNSKAVNTVSGIQESTLLSPTLPLTKVCLMFFGFYFTLKFLRQGLT